MRKITNEDNTSVVKRTLRLWPDCGEILGLPRNSVYELARQGRIPGLLRLGRRLLVRKEVFENWLAGEDAPAPEESR